ncbi:hypothetical protein [Labilibacter marinus]|uniref:hypothetical protein n=1 Tax=Labilibacter marinus TaxID=1477105 RepID=UPI0008357E94|nr:hypothetical protein [Labilibacter marinus]
MIENLGYNNRIQQLFDVVRQINILSKRDNWNSDYHLISILKSLNQYTEALGLQVKKIKVDGPFEQSALLKLQHLEALRGLLTGYTFHPDEYVKNCAIKIRSIVDHHSIAIENDNCFIYSKGIKALLKDLVKPSIVSLMDPLPGVIELCDKFYHAQYNFNQLLNDSSTQDINHEDWEALCKLKKVIVDLIDQKLSIYLKSRIKGGDVFYADVALGLANIITEVRNPNTNLKTQNKLQEAYC